MKMIGTARLKETPAGDVRKKWIYRAWLAPEALPLFLAELAKRTGCPHYPTDCSSVPPVEHESPSEESLKSRLSTDWNKIPTCSPWRQPLVEVPVSRGKVDLLAESKVGNRVLVIEAKAGRAGLQVLEQLRCYMECVRREVNQKADCVGWIIAEKHDSALQSAAGKCTDVQLVRWQDLFD